MQWFSHRIKLLLKKKVSLNSNAYDYGYLTLRRTEVSNVAFFRGGKPDPLRKILGPWRQIRNHVSSIYVKLAEVECTPILRDRLYLSSKRYYYVYHEMFVHKFRILTRKITLIPSMKNTMFRPSSLPDSNDGTETNDFKKNIPNWGPKRRIPHEALLEQEVEASIRLFRNYCRPGISHR